MPLEMVAPEREKPLKGRHRPCTAPMMPAHIARAGRPLRLRTPLAKPGGQNQDAGSGERRGDELEVTEQILDFGVWYVLEYGPLQNLLDDHAHDPGNDGCEQDPAGDRPECGNAAEVSAAPLSPEIGDHREHGAGMQHHEEQRHGGRGRVETEQLLGDDHVCGARYR
jgi:hypothetical protein